MRLEVFLACMPIAPLGWLLSLRRTPWSGPWLCASLAASLWSGLAFAWPHVSVVGDAAATGLPIALAVLGCVLVVECLATDPKDEISRWRRARKNLGDWEIVTSAAKLDGGKETVFVGIRTDSKTRWIGEADPIDEMDAFMNLRAEAEQARETLNALKVGS